MELNEFITEVLTQLSIGVDNAKTSIKAFDIPEVLEAVRSLDKSVSAKLPNCNAYKHVEFIDFEVILTEQTGKENKKGIGVLLSSIGAKAEKNTNNENTNQTKVNFRIPIVWDRQVVD